MSRYFKYTPDYLNECRAEFEQLLASLTGTDNKISYTKTFGTIDRKATLYFEDVAWMKMHALVREFDKEVAWHGVVTRGEDETKDEYIISDILVYPQEVTGTTVDMDVEGYSKWLYDNREDERFSNIRMQGHSHVNMTVTPSGTDLSHQNEILAQLKEDSFYIFVIWNKSGAKNIRIYDIKKNIIFETSDIDIVVKGFIEEAKNIVTEKKYTPPATTYPGCSNYTGYPNYTGVKYAGSGTASVNANTNNQTNNTPVVVKKAESNTPVKKEEAAKSGRRKGKRRDKKNKKNNYSKYPYYDYTDDYDWDCYGG